MAMVFMICLSAASVYAEPSDIKGHWASEEINRWIDRGVLVGSYGKIAPDELISRAGFVSLISRIVGYGERPGAVFSDVKDGEWYAKDIYKAAGAGILVGYDGKIRPEDPVSRQEAAVILTKVFGIAVKDKHAADKFSDAAAIPSWSRDAICAMVENGFASAKSGNAFAPADRMTRAETVKMIDSTVSDLKNKPGTYTGEVDGNLVVNSDGITLDSMTVSGNLYLTEGIGNGSVTLKNVTVKGMTIVSGGGEHSITVSNSSLNGRLIVIKTDGKVRIVAEGKTAIPDVQMRSGGILEENDLTGSGFGGIQVAEVIEAGQEIRLDGNFDDVSVEAPGTGIRLESGSVKSLKLNESAAGAVVSIAGGAVLDTLTLDAAAIVKGEGKIGTANINANGVTMEQKPGVVNKKEGITLPSNLEAAAGAPAVGGVPGGGGPPIGGGADLKIRSAYADVGSSQVSASEQGGGWVVSLAGMNASSMVTDLHISVSDDVKEAEVSYLFFSENVHFSNNAATINIHSMLGEEDNGAPGVSVQSVRDYGGATFSVVLKGSDGSTKSVSITVSP